MSNGKRLSLNIGILNILVIFIFIYLVTSLLFKYLIKSNKIKSSKLSRLFYTDDETFIKKWEKNRKKGKFMYTLYYIIINSIVILATSILYSVVADRDFNLTLFCGLLTGNIIGLLFKWNMNEEKYYKFIE